MTPRERNRERRDLGQQVEGRRAVRELLVAGTRRVHELWLSSESDELEALGSDARARVRKVPADQVARRARTDAPQGVIAFAAPIELADLDAID